MANAESSNRVIIGTILVCDQMYFVLFGLGSTYSYISIKFALGINLGCDVLDSPMHSLTPI